MLSFTRGNFLFLAVALAVSVPLTQGCATETGRSTVGGLIYGSMLGTTIAPGIGSAIGAGVGALAGAIEGTQKKKHEKSREEVYRSTFYRPRHAAGRESAPRRGAPVISRATPPSGRFSNLHALQDYQPLVSMLEREVHEPRPTKKIPEKEVETPSSPLTTEGEVMESRVAKLHQELLALRRERRELEAQVGRLTALLEEYDGIGRGSNSLLSQMEEELGLLGRKAKGSPSGPISTELHYLQEEYELALRIRNRPLAEAVAGRFERLSGQKPLKRSVSSMPPLPSGL